MSKSIKILARVLFIVMFVHDLAHDLFQDILNGYDARRPAVLIRYNGEMGLFFLQVFQQFAGILSFRHKIWLSKDLRWDFGAKILAPQLEEILGV